MYIAGLLQPQRIGQYQSQIKTRHLSTDRRLRCQFDKKRRIGQRHPRDLIFVFRFALITDHDFLFLFLIPYFLRVWMKRGLKVEMGWAIIINHVLLSEERTERRRERRRMEKKNRSIINCEGGRWFFLNSCGLWDHPGQLPAHAHESLLRLIIASKTNKKVPIAPVPTASPPTLSNAVW